MLPLSFNEEHFQLYLKYQKNRHEKNKTTDDDVNQYSEFLLQSNIDSRLIQFKDQEELKIVKEDNIRLVKENATLVDLLPGRGGYRKRKQFMAQRSTRRKKLVK